MNILYCPNIGKDEKCINIIVPNLGKGKKWFLLQSQHWESQKMYKYNRPKLGKGLKMVFYTVPTLGTVN